MQLREPPPLVDQPRHPGWVWRIGAALFVAAIPLFLISTSVRLIAQDIRFYDYGFAKYTIPQRTNLPPAELSRAAQAFVRYFDSEDEWLLVTVTDRTGRTFSLFNERELLHMQDVKGLFQLVWRIQILSGLGIGLYGLARFLRFGQSAVPDLRRLGVWGGAATLSVVALLGGMALIDFETIFIQFHLLSFTNNLWMLDPTRDYLLMMFPEGFFYDATIAIAGLTVAGAIALIGLFGFLAPRLDPELPR